MPPVWPQRPACYNTFGRILRGDGTGIGHPWERCKSPRSPIPTARVPAAPTRPASTNATPLPRRFDSAQALGLESYLARTRRGVGRHAAEHCRARPGPSPSLATGGPPMPHALFALAVAPGETQAGAETLGASL